MDAFKTFKSLADFDTVFADELAAVNHFRVVRWPDMDQWACPHCGVIGAPYMLGNGTFKCRDKVCLKKSTVRNNTIFEDSKIDLRKWFKAVFLMTSHKKGISSCQLAKDIGVSQKSAWFMLQRIRNASLTHEFKAPLTGIVEADEPYVGPNAKWQHKDKKNPLLVGMAAAKTKKTVFAMLQRDGELRVHHVKDTRKATIAPIIQASIAAGAEVHTDESPLYAWMRSAYAHKMVTHSLGEYVRDGITTNRVEGAFSHFKRTIYGTYHKASGLHLDRYLQMFAFRWNTGTMKDAERMNMFLGMTAGKRLTYRVLTRKGPMQ